MDPDRELLVSTHVELVHRSVDRRLRSLPRSVERDELIGWGLLGLVQAADRFDQSLGVPFPAFAQTRIDGAITDGLRAVDPLTTATRSAHRRIQTVRDELRSTVTPLPGDPAVAESAGMTIAELQRTLVRVAGSLPVELAAAERNSLLPAADTASEQPERATLDRCMVARINEMIERLSESQRTALVGTYLDGRTGVEVAAALGVSAARVSQLRNEAIALLREWIDTLPA